MNAAPGVVEAATALLVLHQRTSIRGCHCGQVRLGESHARHLAELLAGAGLLLAPRPRKDAA